MHQRLKGASVASYYPPRIGTIAQLRSLYPQHELTDEAEEDWIEHLNVARSRGKAVPKKKRTAAGTFAGLWREIGMSADKLQNRRSTTRGDKRTAATRYPPRDAVYVLYKRVSDGVHLALSSPQIYTSQRRNDIDHDTHTRTHALKLDILLDYNLLFTPISVFPFTTPCSFSNSSSQGILAFAWSGCTAAFTLWCSTVQ